MPIDPSIALGAQTPAPINPLGIVNQYLPILQTGAQLQNIQSETQARQLQMLNIARQIQAQNTLAGLAKQAINPDTGELDPVRLSTLAAQNPLTSPLGPQILNQARESQLNQIQIAAKTQEMVTKGISDLSTMIAAGWRTPDTIVPRMQAYIKSMPKEVQGPLHDWADDTYQGLFDNLPDNPNLSPDENSKAKGAIIQQRLKPVVAQYLNETQFNNTVGKPVQVDDGNRIWQGLQDSFTSAVNWQSNSVKKGLAPGIGPQGSVVQGGIPGGPMSFLNHSGPTNQIGGSGANALGVSPPQASASHVAPLSAPAPAPALPSTTPTSWLTNKPFEIPDAKSYFSSKTDLAGRKIPIVAGDALPPTGPGSLDQVRQGATNATTTLGFLHDIEGDYNALSPSGWLAPGAGGTDRADIARMVTGFINAGPDKWKEYFPNLPSNTSAAIESMQKDVPRLTLAAVTEALGVQREAAQTIQSVMKSVPTIDNTKLGGMTVLKTLEGLSHYAQDKYSYMTQYAHENGGYINNTLDSFIHNPDNAVGNYTNKALAEIGLNNDKQFLSRPALDSAVRNKMITPEQAKQQFLLQWGNVDPRSVQ